MEHLNLDETASMLRVSTRSLSDKRYRARTGIAAARVGRHLIFAKADVLALLDRGQGDLGDR